MGTILVLWCTSTSIPNFLLALFRNSIKQSAQNISVQLQYHKNDNQTNKKETRLIWNSNVAGQILTNFTFYWNLLTCCFCWCVAKVSNLFTLLIHGVAVLCKWSFKDVELVVSKNEPITSRNMRQHVNNVRMTWHVGCRQTSITVWSVHLSQLS